MSAPPVASKSSITQHNEPMIIRPTMYCTLLGSERDRADSDRSIGRSGSLHLDEAAGRVDLDRSVRPPGPFCCARPSIQPPVANRGERRDGRIIVVRCSCPVREDIHVAMSSVYVSRAIFGERPVGTEAAMPMRALDDRSQAS